MKKVMKNKKMDAHKLCVS